jgi:alpha-beta hydrolase superfamily lysophospholipase
MAKLLFAIILIAAVAQHVIVLHPDDVMDSPQPKAPLTAWTDGPGRSRVTLRVPGAILRGYSYRGNAPNAPVLVMFGGSGNLIKRHDGAARGFARFVSRVVWYDYRGYGFSSGTAHFETLRSDALRIFDAVAHAPVVRKNVVVLGYSMGTAIADYVAVKRPVRGLILAAPWSDYVTTSEYSDPKHRYRLSPRALADFDETAMIEAIREPLLVVQGTKDDAIPPTQGRQLEALAASTDKRFVPILGAKHDWLLENTQTQTALHRFLEHLLAD